MHEIKHTPPDKMTPEQRRQEVASLLANGLARFRVRPSADESIELPAGGFGLGFPAHQRVHTDPVNNRKTEPQ